MSLLKPGTLCVIVAGCPENIGLVVEVLEHLGPYPPSDDAYLIQTVSGRNFPQLKMGPKERLARGCSNEAITDRHKLRPLEGVEAEDAAKSCETSSDPTGTPQEKVIAAADRSMLNRFTKASREGKSLEDMDAEMALWWWNRY